MPFWVSDYSLIQLAYQLCDRTKERATELVEEWIALMLKTNSSFNTNIPIRPIKIALCPLIKGNRFKAY